MGDYIVHARNVSTTGAAVKTLLQVVGEANSRIQVVSWGISLSGVTASQVPGDVDLLLQTDAGTMSAFTPIKWDAADPAAVSTAQHTATIEPSAGDILHPVQLTPNGGVFEVDYGDSGPVIAASGRVGIRANFADNQTVSAWLRFRE